MDEETTATEEERRMNLAQARNRSGETNQDTERSPREGKSRRINPVEAGLMIGVSLLIDIIQILLGLMVIGIVLNPVLSLLAWLTFFLWFHSKGMSYGASLKKGFASAGKNPMVINAAVFGIELVDMNLLLFERTIGILVILAVEYAGQAAKKTGMGKLLEKAGAV